MFKASKYTITIIFVFLITIGLFAYAQEGQEANSFDNTGTSDAQPEQALTKFEDPVQENMRGLVLELIDEGSQDIYGQEQRYAVYKVRITDGSKKGEEIEITAALYQETDPYRPGDKVLVLLDLDFTGEDVYYITDYNRTGTLITLGLIFIVLVVLVSKKWGVASLIGLFYSFAVIFKFILPQLSQGANPVLIAISGSLAIAPVTFYLSHGLNRKTTIALISTVIALIITGILAAMFIELTRLTGFGSEEALFLQYAKGGAINIKGLLLAGIILGALGILDDVTVSQAAVVFQIKKANKKLDATETFHMAMEVGHDHIASTINTLILVYTGATLPLLLLFINNPVSTFELVNSEIIVEEIVRTLVGSIGLILAVPITTLLATNYYSTTTNVKKKKI